MSLPKKRRTNPCNTQLAEKYQKSSVSERAQKQSLFGPELLESIKNLRFEYNEQLKRKNIKRVDQLRSFQWDFWKQKATEMYIENAKVFIFMNKSRGQYSLEAIKSCWHKISQFVIMIHLLNRDIRTEFVQNSIEKSELTVLISVETIQKYCCREYIKDWKSKALETRRASSKPTEKLNETEVLVTQHVEKYLKNIYEQNR